MNGVDFIVGKYWVHQDEPTVAKIRKEHPEYIVAVAYEGWLDSDVWIIFSTNKAYEEYKNTYFTSMYSGWITTDVDFDKVFGGL